MKRIIVCLSYALLYPFSYIFIGHEIVYNIEVESKQKYNCKILNCMYVGTKDSFLYLSMIFY